MQDTYNVGIYARLSRDDERTGESVSIENQKELLAQYVKEQGWNLYSYYCDDGISGTTFDRPQFNRLVQDATDGKINLVLCKDLSRLGRDYIEAGRYTDYIFPSLGCRFIALNDGVDTISTVQRLEPLAEEEKERLFQLVNVYRDAGPIGSDLSRYAGLALHGVAVTAIMETYNICQLQPNPGFSDDNNYFKNAVAEKVHLDIFGELPDEKLILDDGTDVTEEVLTAERWLIEHSF